MRLINIETLKFEEFLDYKTPHYAILSHTWGHDSEELSFRDVEEGNVEKPGVGAVKLKGSCQQAYRDGYRYVWIDTCCIDKSNSVELSEAINSMFRWYRRASCCYAYLADVPADDDTRHRDSKFRASRWFSRGWTLQELIAPTHVRFYNCAWAQLGSKATLYSILQEITGIPVPYLLKTLDLRTASVAQRMSWAAKRETKRKEDLAYCLLGIFNVTMPMIYGEGKEQAFFRLQEHIIKATQDDSILAWGLGDDAGQMSAKKTLAASPLAFLHSGNIVRREQRRAFLNPLKISSDGVEIHIPVVVNRSNKRIGVLNCGTEETSPFSLPPQRVVIPLVEAPSTASGPLSTSDVYLKSGSCYTCSEISTTDTSQGTSRRIHIIDSSQASISPERVTQYWVYESNALSKLHLELVEVIPLSCWDREGEMFITAIAPLTDAPDRAIVRLRQKNKESPDLVLFVNSSQQGEPRCHVAICDRKTTLQELADKIQYVFEKARGSESASNGFLHVSFAVRSDPHDMMSRCTIEPEELEFPPAITINMTLELEKSSILSELRDTWKEKMVEMREELGHGKRMDIKNKKLESVASEVEQRLKRNYAEQRQVRQELWALRNKFRALEQDARLLAIDKNQLEKQICLRQARELESSQSWNHAGQRWDELWRIHHVNGSYRWTPLQWATAHGEEDMINLLLQDDFGAAFLTQDTEKSLIAASRQGYKGVVRYLLDSDSVNVDCRDRSSNATPLILASRNGHLSVVELLLSIGNANVNARDRDKRTPLIWAAERGLKTIVKILLEYDADADVMGADGGTALSTATRNQHIDIMGLLGTHTKDFDETAQVDVKKPLPSPAPEDVTLRAPRNRITARRRAGIRHVRLPLDVH